MFKDKEELADIVEEIRYNLCSYLSRDRCDCKYIHLEDFKKKIDLIKLF